MTIQSALSPEFCKLVNFVTRKFDFNTIPKVRFKLFLPSFPHSQNAIAIFLNNRDPKITLPELELSPYQDASIPTELKVQILEKSANMAAFIYNSRIFN